MNEATLENRGSGTDIAVYSWISRMARPGSFMGKVFLTCFLGTHIPLIGFGLYIVFSTSFSLADVLPQVIVLLVATVISFAVTLWIVHHLLAPVRMVSTAMDTYVKSRALPNLPVQYEDELGLLMRNAQTALEELDFALRTTDARANTDYLTGLGNKRWIAARGAFAFDLARRRGENLSAIILDIDHFKQLNDNFGHATGDDVLKKVGELMRQYLRPLDIVGRIGGEEFCILAVGCDTVEATAIAARIHEAFHTEDFALPDDHKVTASFGIAQMTDAAESLDDVLAAADSALYKSKQAGRDRLMCA